MRDKAKRKRKFEASVADNQKRVKQGKKARSMSEREANTPRTKAQEVRRLQEKAAEMRDKANAVDRSGTGNKKAAATYRQVAEEYLKRAVKIRARKK